MVAFMATGMNRVRWGIIGCGSVTEIKSGPGFQLAAGSELVAVMRRQGHLAEDYARRHGVPKWYADAGQLINDPDVDAVYVATPVGYHHDYALMVSQVGKPCYVEKPMARNTAECNAMIEAFEKKGMPLFVAYYRRGLDRFLKTREMVLSGLLGDSLSIKYRFSSVPNLQLSRVALPWRFDPALSGGGLFLDLGSHTLDILDFIFGPLRFVKGNAARRRNEYDVEDGVALEFSANNGSVTGLACWDFCGSERADLIEISGERGTLSLSTFGDEPLRYQPLSGDIREISLPNPRHIQQPLIQGIVNQLRGDGTSPSTGVSAARTSKLMDQALDSYYGGRDDAFWLRPETWRHTKQVPFLA